VPWTAIVNPVAGRGRTQKLLPDLERAAAAAGIELYVSPEPGAPTKLARAAADEGRDLVTDGREGAGGVAGGGSRNAGPDVGHSHGSPCDQSARRIGDNPPRHGFLRCSPKPKLIF
jgi:hypothetical protein